MGREMAMNLFTKTFNESSKLSNNTSFVVCDALPESATAFANAFLKANGTTARVIVAKTPGE